MGRTIGKRKNQRQYSIQVNHNPGVDPRLFILRKEMQDRLDRFTGFPELLKYRSLIKRLVKHVDACISIEGGYTETHFDCRR